MTTATDPYATTRALTARKSHRCEGHGRRIRPGDRYLRHTAFPGHDAAGDDRPMSVAECVSCATRYGRDHQTGACLTFCHGETPCPLPDRHAGDHHCPDCEISAARPPRGVPVTAGGTR